MSEEIYHVPALLPECLEGLNLRPGGVYVDATFGGGGHSRAILKQLDDTARLVGFDQDLDARANVPDDPRFIFIHSNFRYLRNQLRFERALPADGILADLGVSFHHFDSAERGFSFRADAPLDMRMNRNASRTAADIVNTYDAGQLWLMLRNFGDLKNPRPVVAAIERTRADGQLLTTGALADAVRPTLNPRREKKELAQVFQALRIEVNGEMDALRLFLEQTASVLRPGGRLCIITYHSLEDRMVKNFMRTGNVAGEAQKDFFGVTRSPWRMITRQPIEPSEEEVERNPRSRSAKLRIAELIDKPGQ
ncbi:MAG: 16S rRNA (cytosine(1402)-N(4))-methyltransferase RsmH [Muribaculaceae bacterium]|nr:16S rRNA (cytosine(1402)-N(4))-methyltransferase RsmH [Muribaculaceae bacterium]